jgi:hypothetical protein
MNGTVVQPFDRQAKLGRLLLDPLPSLFGRRAGLGGGGATCLGSASIGYRTFTNKSADKFTNAPRFYPREKVAVEYHEVFDPELCNCEGT